MSINDFLAKIKSIPPPAPDSGGRAGEVIDFDKIGQPEEPNPVRTLIKKLFITLVILLVALLSFGVGRLTGGGSSEPIKIEYDPSLLGQSTSQSAAATQAIPAQGGEVVASKSGSKYHYLHCSGAKQIKPENKITFASAQAAEGAGYTLAANCKGP